MRSGMPYVRRQLGGAVLIAAAAASVVVATPSIASATGNETYDPTYGAWAEAVTYRDPITTGTYVKVEIDDRKADGKCAHARLRWEHNNGNYYYDSVNISGRQMLLCGENELNAIYYTGVRNQERYQKVELQVWVTGGQPSTVVQTIFSAGW